MNKRRIVSAIAVLFVSISLLWVSGIIPSLIARNAAEKYVADKYPDKDFEIIQATWEKNWDCYFVSLKDKNGKVLYLKMSRYFPNTIMYDPHDPPG